MENFLYLLIPLCAGWLLDKRFGDPPKLPHPIVFFGLLIASGEQKFNHGNQRFWKGAIVSVTLIAGTFLFSLVLCSMLSTKIIISGVPGTKISIIEMVKTHLPAIVPLASIYFGKGSVHYDTSSSAGSASGYFISVPPINIGTLQFWTYIVVTSILVFYCLAGKTLMKEVREVFRACDRSPEDGRRQVSRIVGRDTSNLSEQEVRTAALETLAENMSDGVIAPLFWYMLLGIPGMLTYKMINTLDSMIGYRNERFILFGRLAAYIDDFANYIPARLTALLLVLVSGKWSVLPFIIKYGKNHLSPNSGYPEAALAGILNCRFGGPHDYFGKTVDKPFIGTNNRLLTTQDMKHAIKDSRHTELLAIIICITILCLIFLPA